MTARDLPAIRRLLAAAVSRTLEAGHSVADADDLIESLLLAYPDGLPLDEELLEEIRKLARKHGLVTK